MPPHKHICIRKYNDEGICRKTCLSLKTYLCSKIISFECNKHTLFANKTIALACKFGYAY